MSPHNIRFYGAEAILMSPHNICFYGAEAILMNTHNIGFYGEVRNIIPKLSSNTLLICSTDLPTQMTIFNTVTLILMLFFTFQTALFCTTRKQNQDISQWKSNVM